MSKYAVLGDQSKQRTSLPPPQLIREGRRERPWVLPVLCTLDCHKPWRCKQGKCSFKQKPVTVRMWLKLWNYRTRGYC